MTIEPLAPASGSEQRASLKRARREAANEKWGTLRGHFTATSPVPIIIRFERLVIVSASTAPDYTLPLIGGRIIS